MKLASRNAVQCLIASVLFLGFASTLRAAQEQLGKWPEKVVRIVVATAPAAVTTS